MSAAVWEPGWLQDAACRIAEPQVWRGVETQYASATTLLVDTYKEHDLLEQLLEGSKPPLPTTRGARKHFLLITPFRYTPRHDSRFRRAGKGRHGLWYGSTALEAACAEVAYWRMRFILDSAGLIEKKIVTRHTFFAAAVGGHGIDLMAPPWVALSDLWKSGRDYSHTHHLAEEAEAAGIEVIQYESVRAPGSACLAVLTPDALNEPPGGLDATRRGWTCTATRDHVMMMSDLDASSRFEWGWS